MENIKIINEHGSLAYVLPSRLDTIFIQIPEKLIMDSETIRLFDSTINEWRTVNMLNQILALLEHESLHIVLDKTVDMETSHKLDEKFSNGLTFETMLYREQWLNNEA